MTAKNREQQRLQESRFLRRIILLLIFVIALFGIAFWNMPSRLVIHTAPDVTKAFEQRANEVPAHAVYGFARILWESINYCEEDCSLEYEKKIASYRNYITKSCQHDLLTHFKNKKNFYTYRSRVLLPTENTIFRTNNVKQVASDAWYVKLEYILKDDVKSISIRDNKMLYPLKVIKSNKPLNANPVGLEVDCYFGNGPVLLESNNN